MKKVAIYTRSSKDLHLVSCVVQEKEIRQKIQEGEEVYRVFTDKALSSTKDVRPQFNEMMAMATSQESPFSKIYCLDTSRFGRDFHSSQYHLWELRRKSGVEVVFTTMPNTGTYLDPAFEKIMAIFDEIHSQQSKAKGVASMKQNVRDGYRAGGDAPFGYKLKHIDMGVKRNGNSVEKSILTIDPETAPILQEYFERRARLESRPVILEDFQKRGILTPGKREVWSPSTAKSFEDNIDVYLGHTVFNRINERIKVNGKLAGYVGGKKYKDKKEWVTTKDTHEPLISPETADKIKQIKARGLRETPGRAKSVFALSGLISCAECGSNYTGDRIVYRCNYRNKVGLECNNNSISKNRLESAMFSLIKEQVLNFKNVKTVIARIIKGTNTEKSDTLPLEKRIKQLQIEGDRVLGLLVRGCANPERVERKLNETEERLMALEKELETARHQSNAVTVDAKEVSEAINNFREEVENADPKIRKRAMMALIQSLTIFPKNDQGETVCNVKGVSLPLTRLKMASPVGFEPALPA